MSSGECFSEQEIDDRFVRSLAELLEETFGFRFELWLPGDPWRRVEPGGRAVEGRPPERLRPILEETRQAQGPPVYRQSADGPLLAIPVRRKRALALVATAFPPATSADWTRLSTAFAREVALREELEAQRAANKAYAIEMTRSFEELFLLRRIAEYLDLSDVCKPSSDMADATIALLADTIESQCVLWIDCEGPGEQAAGKRLGVGKVIAGAGSEQIDSSLARAVIECYQELAAIQPVVKNHVHDSPDAGKLPGVRELVLVTVGGGERSMGWIVAINRRPADRAAGHAVWPCWSHDEFGSVEAGLVSTAATILAAHARNIQRFREREDTFLGAVRALVDAIEAIRRQYTSHGAPQRTPNRSGKAAPAMLPAMDAETPLTAALGVPGPS